MHLEDDPNDAALIKAILTAGGIACVTTCVKSELGFLTALERGDIDLVLSDFSLPGFDGISAAQLVRTKWPGIPVIMVSGTLGEELAIDALKNGATDYVLKERLLRLVPAVRRAMQEVESLAERRRLEAQFIESQKMEVVGKLASGVAHDFNHVLAVIMGYSDLMLRKLGSDPVLEGYLETIRHAAERGIGLTRQLLVFGRRQVVQPVVLNLNDVVKSLDKMLRRLIRENIEMTFAPGVMLWRVKADSGYLDQVLMNLVVNARDAMPHGGKITIATANVTLGENESGSAGGVSRGDYVMLNVSDTGTGMTDEVKAHLFEVFYTTKPNGKGTGLGLATCQTIVKQSGGHIDVESRVGHGTTFKIYLPRTEDTLAITAETDAHDALPRGSETLLVVEDDPPVREMTCTILEYHGYEVLSAANGQAGLKIAMNHKGAPIRLVLTDVVMPLMGGRLMAQRLRLVYPDIRILFTSGYTDDTTTHQDGPGEGAEFLPKPYTAATLLIQVREMLDGASNPNSRGEQSTARQNEPTPV